MIGDIMYDLIVLGAGPGGYEAAAHAGELGKKVALIEKKHIGGICLNSGCIPTKTLLHSAKILNVCKEAEDYGIKTGKLEIDFGKIQKRKKEVVALLLKGIEGKLKRSGVEIIWGEGRLLSKNAIKVNEKSYETKNILIATGSRPIVPPIKGIDSSNVLDSTAILELDTIPKSLAVIGAGAIGLELACFFNEMGTNVKVIEMLPHIAYQMDTEITSYLLKSLEKKGIDFALKNRPSGKDQCSWYLGMRRCNGKVPVGSCCYQGRNCGSK